MIACNRFILPNESLRTFWLTFSREYQMLPFGGPPPHKLPPRQIRRPVEKISTELWDSIWPRVVQGAIRIFVFDKDPSSPSHLHIYKIITIDNTKYITVSIYDHASLMQCFGDRPGLEGFL